MERETVMHRATILDPPTEPVPKPELICEPYVHATEKRVFLINLNSFELWHGHGDTHHRHTYIHDSLRLMSTVITLLCQTLPRPNWSTLDPVLEVCPSLFEIARAELSKHVHVERVLVLRGIILAQILSNAWEVRQLLRTPPRRVPIR